MTPQLLRGILTNYERCYRDLCYEQTRLLRAGEDVSTVRTRLRFYGDEIKELRPQVTALESVQRAAR